MTGKRLCPRAFFRRTSNVLHAQEIVRERRGAFHPWAYHPSGPTARISLWRIMDGGSLTSMLCDKIGTGVCGTLGGETFDIV